MTCAYCGGEKGRALWPTCGAPACKDEHQRARKAANARDRYETLKAEGVCPRCGCALDKKPSKVTGQRVGRCARCRRKANETQRAVTERKSAEKKKAAAALRLADAKIARRRTQQARLDAGLDISLAPNPKMPKNKGIRRVEL